MSQDLNINPSASVSLGGSPTRELLTLAAPIILMMVTRMMMGFIDFVMVSALGTEAQAAISPASLFVFTIGCCGMGIANAVQTYVAQAEGRGQSREAGGYAWQSLYLSAALALLVIPVVSTTQTWFGWIAALGRHSPEVAALEVAYVRIGLWCVVPGVICIGLESFFNGIRRPRICLLAVLTALAVNALGNWLLIYGKLGFPQMGIAGAAVATVIGWWARAAVSAVAILRPSIDQQYNTRRSLGLCLRKLTGLLRIGVPTAAQWVVDLGSWIVFMMLIVPPLGITAMAASNVGLQLMHLSFMPAIGVGIALCSQVGYAIGAGQPDRAVARTRVALWVTTAYMGAVGLLLLAAREPLTWLFNRDPAVIQAGAVVLIWAAVFQVFDAMGITFMNALRGAGDTRWPAIVIAVCCWGVFVGGGYAMSHFAPGWGLHGPWAMCTTYIVLVGLALGWRWQRGTWRQIKLFAEPPAAVPAPPLAPAAAPLGSAPE